jgi:DNA-binding transcriptional MerR regulator
MARNATIDATAGAPTGKALGIGRFRRNGTGQADRSADAAGDRPMTIAEVAREFGVTLRALRFYESKRLLAPQRYGPIRLYHRKDRERLGLILTGRRLGFTLAEIAELLSKPYDKGLHLTREQCVTQINLLERQKRRTEIAIAELRQIYTSFYRALVEDADLHFRRAE